MNKASGVIASCDSRGVVTLKSMQMVSLRWAARSACGPGPGGEGESRAFSREARAGGQAKILTFGARAAMEGAGEKRSDWDYILKVTCP